MLPNATPEIFRNQPACHKLADPIIVTPLPTNDRVGGSQDAGPATRTRTRTGTGSCRRNEQLTLQRIGAALPGLPLDFRPGTL
jgi:hypothetical protein